MDELKPCPFCGAQPKECDVSEYFVECPSCGLEGPRSAKDSRDDASEAWNRRESGQVSEPSVSDSELAQRILTVLGYATEPSMEPGADERRDRIAEIIASNAAPCARCAELEATNRQLNREVISVGDEAEDYAGKLAALEAELSGLRARYLRMESEDAATIAQQAGRIKELTVRDHAVARTIADLLRSKHSLKEQLAAAERDAERYRMLKNGDFSVEQFVAYSYGWKTIDMKGLDAAIDAAIAASREGEK